MIYFSIGIILIVFCVDIIYMNSIYVHLCKNKATYKKHNELSSALSILFLAVNGIIIFATNLSDVLLCYNLTMLLVCSVKNILSIEAFKKFKLSSEEYYLQDDETIENIEDNEVENN